MPKFMFVEMTESYPKSIEKDNTLIVRNIKNMEIRCIRTTNAHVCIMLVRTYTSLLHTCACTFNPSAI